MKLTNLTLLLFFISFFTHGQETFNSDDLRVTNYDLKATSFPKDSLAPAVVLYEMGNAYVNRDNFKLTIEVKKKIKILTQEGSEYANISIPLYVGEKAKDKLISVNASSFNLQNGELEKTQLNASDVFYEDTSYGYTLAKLAIPNSKKGSVITYSYTIESVFFFNFRGWSFQSEIPKLTSEYKTSIPGNWEYNIKLVGGLKLFNRTETIEYQCLEVGNGSYANCSNIHYIMKDIPAYRAEEYTTSHRNYLSRIHYELAVFRRFDGFVKKYSKTWEQADKELRSDDNLGKQFYKKGPVKDIVGYIKKGNSSLETAQSAYNYVQSTYTWNNALGIYGDNSVKNLMKESSGNIVEINTLLLNLLHELDIEVYPVFASTRQKGFITRVYPVISDFNYLFVKAVIDGNTYYLDATEKYNPFGELPFRALNHYARVLDIKYGSFWEDIDPKKVSTYQNKIELSISKDNTLNGKMNVTSSGYKSLGIKSKYFFNPLKYLEAIQSDYEGIDLKNHKLLEGNENSFTVKEEFDISYSIEELDGKFYINPFINPIFKENPFKLQQRTYPIDFGYKDAYLYRLKINVDENFDVLEVPEQQVLSLPNNSGKLIFSTKKTDNSVEVYFKVNFNETLYASEFYPYLKEFFSQLVDIQTNSLIVLKKKQQ